ncbi:MAG: flagellar filament capping protein FliD [Candidatus Baltobacteraceae bacterium]
MSGTSSVPGTNVPPVSFPGIASGIDYNSIITKLTSLSLQPTVSLSSHAASLNAANTELIKINGLLASVQNSLTALSQSEIFSSVSATSSNATDATASGIPGVYASPGTYTIQSTSLATATVVTGAANLGHVITDTLPGTTASSADVPLIDSYAAITPSNGSGTTGSVTIDGVTVNYNVASDSLNTILANINAAEAAAGDTGFNISLNGSGAVQIADSSRPVSLGAQGDSGNLLHVLRLDAAQVVNTSSSGSVTATAGVGGINQALEFNSQNGLSQSTNANYVTPVTSGTFTINGVQIAVNNATDNLASLIKRINASSAGVVASYDASTGAISLASSTTGPKSIVLGSASDTSNFLSATGLTAASGAGTSIGTQASLTIETPSGSTKTIYSNSNSVTSAIPGVQINLVAATSVPFEITVGQDTSGLTSALNTFISAYNAAVNEINVSTSPPVVASATGGNSIGITPTAAVGGGILYNNADVQTVKNRLINIVTALNTNGGAYNSLSAIGLNLTSSFTQLAQNTSGSQAGQISAQVLQGTDGQIAPLDAGKLAAALAANPTAVQSLVSGAGGLVASLGSYLTSVTGVPTNTATAILGTIPAVSLIQGFENANTSSVQSIQQQITQIQNNVNMQADQLRREFVSAEAQIAQMQSLQSQLGSFFKTGSGG